MQEDKQVTNKDIIELVDYLKQSNGVREKELTIEQEAIRANDRDSERQFEAYKLGLSEHSKNNNFIRTAGMLSLLTFIGVITFGCFLLYKNVSYGKDLLEITISLISGGLAGWGISQSSKK